MITVTAETKDEKRVLREIVLAWLNAGNFELWKGIKDDSSLEDRPVVRELKAGMQFCKMVFDLSKEG